MMTNDGKDRFTFRVSKKLFDKARKLSDETGMTLNGLLLTALMHWIKVYEQKGENQ